MLKLIVADSNLKLLSTWSEVFQGIPEVMFMNIDFKSLVKLPIIDVVLIRWVFAHERYGGTPRIGQSQILSANGEAGMPPWIVTTVPFRSDTTPPSEEYDYVEFSKVFESIEQFNKTNKESMIQTLGFELSFLYSFRGELPYKEAKAVRKAYLEHCGKAYKL
ncbi:hypothetical protein WDZ92_04005 [Nostoc sp. NIES-2111]